MASIEDKASFSEGKFRTALAADEAGLRACLAMVGLLLIGRVILAATTDLAEDEAYYWLWSTHLATGYYDHPPMIAYWIRAGTSIFGQTTFGVRVVGLLSAVAGSYLLYRTSLSLFRDRKAALLTVIWMNATLLCNAAAIVATPDTPLAFFTTVTLFALAKLIESERGVWWYGTGAALGLAFMSKYTAALLLPGLLLWMVASAQGRQWLTRMEPYFGAVIAFAVIAPLVYWNYTHDWVSFAKQAQHGIKDKPSNALLSVAEFFGGQAGLATPVIFIFCLFGSFYSLLRGFTRRDPRWLLIGAMSAPAFTFFFLHAAEQKIQPNWPGLVYPAAILAAVHGYLAISEERRAAPWIGATFRFAPWIGFAFTFVTFVQLGFGALPIEAKKDPTSRLKGWDKLGADVEQLREQYAAGSILTDRYAATGELAFYTPRSGAVLQINERIRYTNLPAPDEARLHDAPSLLVLRKGSDAVRTLPYFTTSRFLTTLQREAGFHSRDAYDVHLLTGYRGGLFRQEPLCVAAANQGKACN
jgi:4-amino-4-deoxy-L-arabinose transferase-like glycosyltransferase